MFGQSAAQPTPPRCCSGGLPEGCAGRLLVFAGLASPAFRLLFRRHERSEADTRANAPRLP